MPARDNCEVHKEAGERGCNSTLFGAALPVNEKLT
jgi:hypothetical protein